MMRSDGQALQQAVHYRDRPKYEISLEKLHGVFHGRATVVKRLLMQAEPWQFRIACEMGDSSEQVPNIGLKQAFKCNPSYMVRITLHLRWRCSCSGRSGACTAEPIFA